MKAAFKALDDDKDLDVLDYLEKIDAKNAAPPVDAAAAAAENEKEKEEDSEDGEGKAKAAAAAAAPDSLETKIKKLGLTDKLPEAFKEAYIGAKQKQLEAECEEIMKDETVLEVIKGLETDPVSSPPLPSPASLLPRCCLAAACGQIDMGSCDRVRSHPSIHHAIDRHI